MRSATKWLALLSVPAAILCGGPASAALVSSASSGGMGTFTVSTTDLANNNMPTFGSIGLTSGTANFGSSEMALVEGTMYAGSTADNTVGDRTLTPSDGAVLVLALNTSFSPLGYDINAIETFTGTAQNRAGQAYDVAVSFVGAPDTFSPLFSVTGALPGNSDAGTETRVRTVENAGAQILGTGIAKVQFTFHNCCAGSSIDETMFREIDLFGAASTGLPPVIPPAPVFAQAALTDTAQILAPDADHQLLGALNLIYPAAQGGVAAPGTVNGIPFQNIAWDNGSPQALTLGGTVTVSPVIGGHQRFQQTAGTITGPDEGVLESIANTINFLGAGEQVSLIFASLPADQQVQVQVIGGDNGEGFQNWLGDIEVTANGLIVGTWDIIADDNQTTASLATFLATTDAAGGLNLTFRQINAPPGQFAGIAGLVITTAPSASAVPEPGTLALVGLGALGLLRRRRAA